MSLEIIRSDSFTKEFKRLAKRYRGLVEDYENFLVSLEANPLKAQRLRPISAKYAWLLQPKEEANQEARVITSNALVSEQEGKIYLLLIYDKADASNIKMNAVKEIVKELGL